MLDENDFNIGYEWRKSGDVLYLNHLWLDPDHRGKMNGTFVLETMVRFAYYEGAEVIEVSIGGGKAAEAFLRQNGFSIIRRREYETDVPASIEGEYGVDAVRRV